MSEFAKPVLDYLQNSKMMRKSFENNRGIDLSVDSHQAEFTYRQTTGRGDKTEAHDYLVLIRPAKENFVSVEIHDWYDNRHVYSNTLFCPDKHRIRQIVDKCEQICNMLAVAAFHMSMLDEMT